MQYKDKHIVYYHEPSSKKNTYYFLPHPHHLLGTHLEGTQFHVPKPEQSLVELVRPGGYVVPFRRARLREAPPQLPQQLSAREVETVQLVFDIGRYQLWIEFG